MSLINVLAKLCMPVLETAPFSDVEGFATRTTHHTEPPRAEEIRRETHNSATLSGEVY